MKIVLRWKYRSVILSAMILLPAGSVSGQIPGVPKVDQRARGEISGLAGGSGLLAIDGGTVADGMWAFKGAVFNRGRLGIEGSFEQSTRISDLRYAGADLMFHFPNQDPKRITPYVHAGAGSFLFGSHATGAVSFGAGVKKFFNDRVGVRFGVQDRMSIRQPEYHRLDFYGGIVLRF